eukprot:205938_1
MDYWFREKQKLNYAEPNLTDDYGTLGTFTITVNECHIQQESEVGLLVADSLSYPYFVHDICWVKCFPQNNNDYFFEKQIRELNGIDGIDKYYNWVKSKYKHLLPYYREKLMREIPIKYKYSIGDIIFMNISDEIGQIQDRRYDIKADSILYNVKIIDLNKNALVTLKYFNDITENNIKICICAMDCFVKFNNNPQAIQAYALYIRAQSQCRLQMQKYNTLKQICYESCENVLQALANKFMVWLQSRNFVHQFRSASAPMAKHMFLALMIKYLELEYNVSTDIWKERNNKIKSKILSLDLVAAVFSIHVVKNKLKNGWEIFIAEPIIVWEKNEMRLSAHICDLNPTTKLINGDPDKKRERLHRYNQFRNVARKFYKKLVLAYIRQNTERFEITSNWINSHVIAFFGINKVKAYRNYCVMKGKKL